MATWSDTSGLNYQSLQDAGAPPGPDLIMNFSQGSEKAVGLLYQDEYNQAAQNAYNNAYNYWLWQKQLEYNSPKAQVERLKEAGLNPNFNSIEGTGNASSIPSSQGSVKGNTISSRLQAIGTAVNLVSGLAGSVAKGVQAMKTFSNTPKAIKAYRGLLGELLGEQFRGSVLDNQLKEMESQKLGIFTGLGSPNGGVSDDVKDSLWYRSLENDVLLKDKRIAYQGILNDIKEWEKDNFNPQRLKNLQATWDNIVAGTSLRNINIDWYNSMRAVEIVRALAPLFLRSIF